MKPRFFEEERKRETKIFLESKCRAQQPVTPSLASGARGHSLFTF
jgi:hypothetical protein